MSSVQCSAKIGSKDRTVDDIILVGVTIGDLHDRDRIAHWLRFVARED